MDEAQDKPRMVVLAGPNGSGKSTVTDGLRQHEAFPTNYINADDIARVEFAQVPDLQQRNLQAAQLAEKRRKEALAGGQSFAFETVMSTPGKLALFDEARAAGYQVDLVYVTTENAAINQQRVQNRAAQGGHTVDHAKIAERYERAMQLLPAAIDKADTAMVFDNSVSGRRPLLVAEKQDNRLTVHEGQAPWTEARIGQPMRERQASRDALTAKASASVNGARVSAADVHGNRAYSGVIAGLTDQHALQRVGTSQDFVLHDRTLTPPQTLAEGKATAIGYRFGADGKHQVAQQRQAKTQVQSQALSLRQKP